MNHVSNVLYSSLNDHFESLPGLSWYRCSVSVRYRLQRGACAHGQLWLLHPSVHLRRHAWRLQPGQLHSGPRGHEHEGLSLVFCRCTHTHTHTHRCPLRHASNLSSSPTSSSSSSSSQIPLLQRAQALSPHPLSLLASAWSAPAWMKTNGALTGKGSLKGQPGGKEHKTWAQYYIRWCGALNGWDITCWYTGNLFRWSGFFFSFLSGFLRNTPNITWPSGHWPQGMSPLQDRLQTTGPSPHITQNKPSSRVATITTDWEASFVWL